jgi:hypothetical protein
MKHNQQAEGILMKVILRNERSNTDTRYLSAAINEQGDLVLEGQDIGQAVQAAFDYSEYEWVWTVKAEDVPLFETALGCQGNLLPELEAKFSGDNAANLHQFMQTHQIPHEDWSRIGD